MANIGDTIWYAGDEVTITTDPYELYGGLFQDAAKADGTIVTVKAQ